MKKRFIILVLFFGFLAGHAQQKYDTGLLLRSEELGPAYVLLYTNSISDTWDPSTQEIDGKVYDLFNFYLMNYYGAKTDRYYHFEQPINGILLREADGKVFRYNKEKEAEELLMDYTLEVGDEFVRPDGQRLVVTATSENSESGVKTLQLKDPVSGEEDTWQSDCGSLRTGYLLKGDVPGYQVTNLLKKTRFGFFDIDDPDLVQFTYHPQKLSTDEEVVNAEPLTYEFIEDSLYIHGRYTLSSIPMLYDHIIRLVRNGNDFFIDYVPGYHDDTYIYSSSYWLYDVKIGGFEPGTYHFYRGFQTVDELVCEGKTDPSGKEHTAITHAVASDHTSTLYDLQGRRLVTEPHRGVFIKDGRKVVK